MAFFINGVTRDNSGNLLGSCELILLKYTPGTHSFAQVDRIVSDAVTAAYTFNNVADNTAAYTIVALKDTTPHVFDVSDRNLQPTSSTAPVNTGAPTIGGAAVVGSTLTANDGTWTGNPTPTLTRQWLRGATPIGGATGTTYVVQAGDVGFTIGLSVTGTNTQGNATASAAATAVVTANSWGDDGSANAPSGPANFPNLLDDAAYLFKPPWQVAGVNYRVGIPAGLVLKDPYTINRSGGEVIPCLNTFSATALAYSAAPNGVVDGYDFRGGGAHGIEAWFEIDHPGITFRNCRLGSVSVRTGGCTFINCEFLDTGSTTSEVIDTTNSLTGTVIVRYCYFRHVAQHPFGFIGNINSVFIEFCLFEDIAYTPGSHMNLSQFGGYQPYDPVIINFNTSFQHVMPSDQGTGFQLVGQDQDVNVFRNASFCYNTCVAVPSSGQKCMTFFLDVSPNPANTPGIICHDNYIDPRGTYQSAPQSDRAVQHTDTNNTIHNPMISMLDGHVYPN